MQQYSSLPEQNSQMDATPTLLATIQQLDAELWLERSLNQLQSRLNECLLAAFHTVPQLNATTAKIFQTLVNELEIAFNNHRVVFTRCTVGIALLDSQAAVGKVYYISQPLTPGCQASVLEMTAKKRKRPRLQLQETIKLKDLEQLENQQPPRAWRLIEHGSNVIGWLLLTTQTLKADEEEFTALHTHLISELMSRSADICMKTLAHLSQIESLQQKYQYFADTNQELERSNQLKNQFLANTSHEIRTPLSSIIGFTHLLLAQGYDPSRERHHEYLNIIQSSGKHLLALINDILDLSKIEANQLEVNWEKINVPELCHNVLALVKEKAGNKGLKLSLEIEAEVNSLIADPLRLKQMLLNLLFNALKFTSKGAVGLKVAQKDSFIHFTVWDTGTGISPQHKSQLFQPYFQIPQSSVAPQEGTGLGLVVTHKLAEMHGGSVKVESEINQGSRFTITLPLKPAGDVLIIDDGRDEQIAASSVTITASSSQEVLLIEDDLGNGELIQAYLTKLGYQVTWVKKAAEMWEILTQLQPVLILIDICLPDENGLNLAKQLRQKPKYQHIPIIAQTAMAMKGDRDICLAAGVNDYISKPIDLKLLASLVAKYSQPDVK